jgi:hypothetical protein
MSSSSTSSNSSSSVLAVADSTMSFLSFQKERTLSFVHLGVQ